MLQCNHHCFFIFYNALVQLSLNHKPFIIVVHIYCFSANSSGYSRTSNICVKYKEKSHKREAIPERKTPFLLAMTRIGVGLSKLILTLFCSQNQQDKDHFFWYGFPDLLSFASLSSSVQLLVTRPLTTVDSFGLKV